MSKSELNLKRVQCERRSEQLVSGGPHFVDRMISRDKDMKDMSTAPASYWYFCIYLFLLLLFCISFFCIFHGVYFVMYLYLVFSWTEWSGEIKIWKIWAPPHIGFPRGSWGLPRSTKIYHLNLEEKNSF